MFIVAVALAGSDKTAANWECFRLDKQKKTRQTKPFFFL
jgi:hypothetical protein